MDPANPRPTLANTRSPSTDSSGSSAAEPACAGFYTAADRRNQRRFNLWVLAATAAYVAATAALRWRQSIPIALPWLLAGLTALLAILAARSYLVFLHRADELLRRIQTEALALGFAAGAVFSLLYPLLAGLGAPRLGEHATGAIMFLSWGAGSWLGTRRYAGGGGA